MTFLTLKSASSVENGIMFDSQAHRKQIKRQNNGSFMIFRWFRTCSYLSLDTVFQRKTEYTPLKWNSATRILLQFLTNLNLQVTCRNYGPYCAWHVPFRLLPLPVDQILFQTNKAFLFLKKSNSPLIYSILYLYSILIK